MISHQGALVTTSGLSSGLGPGDGELDQGARVGAIGPGGNRDVSVSEVGICTLDGGAAGPRAAAQGAAVPPGGGAVVGCPVAVAHGALVPGPAAAGALGRGWDVDEVCAVCGGGMALGSRSQLKREPKGKCCTTGNLERTSALYILIMP